MADVAAVQAKLEQGLESLMSDQGFRDYLRVQARFATYSFGNTLLILTQRPDATRVAGFHAWREMGRSVKKGEHGIQILAPMVRRDTHPPDLPGAGETVERPPDVWFRPVYVFDIAQTEGRSLPDLDIHDLAGATDQGQALKAGLLDLARMEGLNVILNSQECGEAHGFYRPAVREIHVAPGLAVDQQAKTLAHELAHHLLGHGGHGESARSVAEVQAESVAFIVCQARDVASAAYSLPYVADWAPGQDAKAKLAAIRQALPPVQRAASHMLGAMQDREREGPEPRREHAARPMRRHHPEAAVEMGR